MQDITREHGGMDFDWAERPEDRSRLWTARHNAYFSGLQLRPGSRASISARFLALRATRLWKSRSRLLTERPAATPSSIRLRIALRSAISSSVAFVAASRGYIDDIIRPQNTRWRICRSLAMLRKKTLQNPWKKHDNLPL